MVVAADSPLFSGPYDGGLDTTVFDYDFKIYENDELQVLRTNADGSEDELALGSDYSVTGVGDDGGGAITLVSSDLLPLGATMLIVPDHAISQERPYSDQSSTTMEEMEASWDKSASIDRQQQRQLDRAPKLPEGSPTATLAIPEAGKTLVGKTDGSGWETGPAADEISGAQAWAEAAQAWAEAAQAWAESAAAPDGGTGKSAKAWSDIAAAYLSGLADRAAAEAATVLAVQTRLLVNTAWGSIAYVRDAAGTALTTSDGATWSPDGPAYPDHWKENATPGVTDMRGAIIAAWGHNRQLCLLPTKYGFTGDLPLNGVNTTGSFEGFSISGAGPESSVFVALDTVSDGLSIDNYGGAASPFMVGRVGGFSIHVEGQTQATGVAGLRLGQVYNSEFRGILIDGYTNHVVLEGAPQNKFYSIYTRNGKRGAELSESVWTVTDGPYSNCYGTELYGCEHHGGSDAVRAFDLQAVDQATVTGGHFNNVRNNVVVRPDGTGFQASIWQVRFNGVYFDGGADTNLVNLYIEAPDPDTNGTNTRIEGIYFNNCFLRAGTQVFKLADGDGDLDGLSQLQDVMFNNNEIQDYSGIHFQVETDFLDDPVARIKSLSFMNNLIEDQGILDGRTGAPSVWRLQGSQVTIDGNQINGGWDNSGDHLITILADSDKVIVGDSNNYEIPRTFGLYQVDVSATRVRVPDAEVFSPATTDETAAFLQKIGRGRVRSGTFALTTDPTRYPEATLMADRLIEGDHGSLFTLRASGAGTSLFMSTGPQFTGTRLTFSATHDTAGETLQVFKPDDDFVLTQSEIDGGVTDAGGSPSHIAHAFDVSSSDVTRLQSIGNIYSRLSRVVLKNTDATSSDENLLFAFDTFQYSAAETLAFNSPNGTMRGVLVIGAHSRNAIGDSLGNSTHLFGGANVEGLRVIASYHYGSGDEIFHAEDGTNLFVSIGNTASFTDARAGVFMADNDESGPYRQVTKGTITSNVLHRETRTGGYAGIDFAPNGQGTFPAEKVVASSNVVDGWERGLRTAEFPYYNLVTGNVFSNNDEGIQMLRPSLSVRDNLLLDNTTTIEAQTTGAMGRQFIARSDVWDFSTPLITAPAASNSHVMWEGWTTEYRSIDLSSGGSNIHLAPLGEYMTGELFFCLAKDNSNRRFIRATIDWDGTTLTTSNLKSFGAGLSFVDFRAETDDLCARISVGAAKTLCTLQMSFNGMHVFSGA